MRLAVYATITGLVFASSAHAAGMEGTAVKAEFFNGKAFTASTPTRVKYTMVFTPDGKATREPLGKVGATAEGAWKIVKDGFCTSWGGNKKFNCYRLVPSGENRWSVMTGATVIAIWSK